MTENGEILKEHNCGFCGRPSCIAYGISPDGSCPFDRGALNDRREELVRRIDNKFRRSRISPVPKEITPCSEYTRFTLETVIEDPNEPGKNSMFEPSAMGFLFSYGNYEQIKWSEKLGYGMAVVDKEVRLMVHVKGKMIIRRAMDRDHAQKHFIALKTILLPSLYCTVTGQTLWEMIVGMHLSRSGVFGSECNKYTGIYGDRMVGLISEEKCGMERVMEGFVEEVNGTGANIRNRVKRSLMDRMFEREDLIDLHTALDSMVKDRLKDIMKNVLGEGPDERMITVGRASFILSAMRALEGISEFGEAAGDKKIGPSEQMIGKILEPWDNPGEYGPLVEEMSEDTEMRRIYMGLFKCMMFLLPGGKSSSPEA